MKMTIGCVVAAALLFAGAVSAHPREYVNNNAGVGVSIGVGTSCPPDSIDALLGERQFGIVIFCAGELVATPAGFVTITIDDDVSDPAGGVFWQDFDADTWADPGETTNVCGTTDVPYDDSVGAVLWLQTVASGNPAGNSICPGETSFPTHGFVLH